MEKSGVASDTKRGSVYTLMGCSWLKLPDPIIVTDADLQAKQF